LAWAAAATTTLRLATGIVILPQRNPVVLAKQVASLDVLSGGRVTLGIGVGYLEPEFRAVGANFEARGEVTDEFLAAMQHLWYDEVPSFHGRHVDFAAVNAQPRPVQRPLPIVVGGSSAPARRRAVTKGHGWYGFRMSPGQVVAEVGALAATARRVERPDPLGALEISVSPPGRITPADAAAYAEAGVDRLVTVPSPKPDGVARAIESAVAATAGL
jgi:probable F420-dependent oxidoreductase